jgi:hypothetical protein
MTFRLTVVAGRRLSPPPFNPYKRRRPMLPFATPPPLIFPLPPSSSTTTIEFPLRHSFSAVTRSPHYRLSPGEARDGLPALPSLCCTLAGVLTCFGVARGQTPASTPPRPGFHQSVPLPVHGGPRGVHRPWTRSTGFPLLK